MPHLNTHTDPRLLPRRKWLAALASLDAAGRRRKKCAAAAPVAARIAAHAARVAAEDPGREPVVCWGCGAASAKRSHTGWPGRWVVLVPGRPPVREIACPACFAAFGFIEPGAA